MNAAPPSWAHTIGRTLVWLARLSRSGSIVPPGTQKRWRMPSSRRTSRIASVTFISLLGDAADHFDCTEGTRYPDVRRQQDQAFQNLIEQQTPLQGRMHMLAYLVERTALRYQAPQNHKLLFPDCQGWSL